MLCYGRETRARDSRDGCLGGLSERPRAYLPLAHLILQHVVLAELVAVFEGLHPNLGEVG